MNENYNILFFSQSLGSDVRVFESVGRMFLLTDMSEIRSNLATKISKSQEKITVLTVCLKLLLALILLSSVLVRALALQS